MTGAAAIRTRWYDPARDLEIRYATPADIADVADMLAMPEVCEHVFFGPNSREETEAYFGPDIAAAEAALARGARPDAHEFVIRRGGAFVGQCACVPVAFGAGNYAIGYQLLPTYWRQGIGGWAGEFLLWFGLEVLGARRLSAECLATNAGSIRILERCGLAREGLQRAYFRSRGRDHDQLLFGLLAADNRRDLRAIAARFEPT
ncbi:MAG: GNAT family N-acetyltransferase [Myxococcales bacterium]|nr:GNAT family N-acetyltransferase [Myxococcales bacterium]